MGRIVGLSLKETYRGGRGECHKSRRNLLEMASLGLGDGFSVFFHITIL